MIEHCQLLHLQQVLMEREPQVLEHLLAEPQQALLRALMKLPYP
jgi:hypothetical protein